jgi:uncharacterized protein YcgI (DUF1989 family)
MNRVSIAARTGRAFRVEQGQRLRVIDVEGQQVADLFAVAADNPSEVLSGIVSTQLNRQIYLTTGHVLYSSRREPLFTIVEDSVGRHDLLMGACSDRVYTEKFGVAGHPNCQALLQAALEPFGVRADVSDTFNVFMNVAVAADGCLSIELPRSKPADAVTLRAERACIVAVSACPADLSPCNGWNPTGIAVEVVAGET